MLYANFRDCKPRRTVAKEILVFLQVLEHKHQYFCEVSVNNTCQTNHLSFCLYIAIKSKTKIYEGLSGKYYLHSLHKNIGAYVREPGEIQGFSSQQFFLVYTYKQWHITLANKKHEFLWRGDEPIGYLRIATKG